MNCSISVHKSTFNLVKCPQIGAKVIHESRTINDLHTTNTTARPLSPCGNMRFVLLCCCLQKTTFPFTLKSFQPAFIHVLLWHVPGKKLFFPSLFCLILCLSLSFLLPHHTHRHTRRLRALNHFISFLHKSVQKQLHTEHAASGFRDQFSRTQDASAHTALHPRTDYTPVLGHI